MLNCFLYVKEAAVLIETVTHFQTFRMKDVALRKWGMKPEMGSIGQPVLSTAGELLVTMLDIFLANFCFWGPGLGFPVHMAPNNKRKPCLHWLGLKQGSWFVCSSVHPRDSSANTQRCWHPSPPPAVSSPSFALLLNGTWSSGGAPSPDLVLTVLSCPRQRWWGTTEILHP